MNVLHVFPGIIVLSVALAGSAEARNGRTKIHAASYAVIQFTRHDRISVYGFIDRRLLRDHLFALKEDYHAAIKSRFAARHEFRANLRNRGKIFKRLRPVFPTQRVIARSLEFRKAQMLVARLRERARRIWLLSHGPRRPDRFVYVVSQLVPVPVRMRLSDLRGSPRRSLDPARLTADARPIVVSQRVRKQKRPANLEIRPVGPARDSDGKKKPNGSNDWKSDKSKRPADPARDSDEKKKPNVPNDREND